MAYKIFDQGDCEQGVTGTGVRNCDISSMGDLKGDILFEKGWSSAITDGTVSFDLAAYLIEVKSMNALPLLDLYDFGQDTPENETNTSSRGIIQEVRAGKPQFSFSFSKGRCFHKSLFNKRGQGRWDHGLMFENGVLMAVNSDQTKIKGFDGGMFSVDTFKLLQGTDVEMSIAKIQLLNSTEFNERMIFIPFSRSGDLGSVNGVIETSIVVDDISPGTTFTASITSSCNTGDSILALDDIDLFYLLGTQTSATQLVSIAYNATTAKYTFRVDKPLIATDKVQLIMSDGVYNVIEDAAGNLYKGTSNTKIVG